MERSLRQYRKKLFLRYEAVSLLLLTLFLVVLFQFVLYFSRQSYTTLSAEQLATTEQRVKLFIADYITDAQFLSELSWVRRLDNDASVSTWQAAREDLRAFARDKQATFDQVRILDERGMERLRIDTDPDNRVYVVPENQLRDKSNRYYFTESRGLEPSQVYVSLLDLNEEDGEIEEPWNPMIRYVTPIRGNNGSNDWTMVLNLRASRMINSLRIREEGRLGKLLYVNPLGYFVEAPQPDMAWGWQLPERVNATVANWNPELATALEEADADTLLIGGDLFVFQMYNPVGVAELGKDGLRSILPDEERSRGHLIIWVKKEIIRAFAWSEFMPVLILAVISILPMTLLSWSLATRQMHRVERAQLREEAEVLRATQSLARGIAHEFRQPLAALKLAADLADHMDLPDDALGKLVKRIPPNVKRVNDLVSQLMHLTKIKEIEYPGGNKILDLHGDESEERDN
ncbi:hypothetical protein KQI63_05375 [bacterium]|nr:hypothetical protein [bacterium]